MRKLECISSSDNDFPKAKMEKVGQSLKTNRKTLKKSQSILFLNKVRKSITEILISLLDQN